jgi:TonB family protein
MFLKVSGSLFFLLMLAAASTAQPANGVKKRGIVNGRAISLPKPEYPPEARDFCAGGKVEIEVSISEKGDVTQARAISGDELLREASVAAVKKAKFAPTPETPVKTEGIVVYNFASPFKCIVTGVVNKKTLSLPKPVVPNLDQPRHFRITQKEIVAVRIIVEMDGKVSAARALAGHLLLRAACETAARGAKFSPMLVNGASIKVSALLVYKFKPGGEIDTNVEKNDKAAIATPLKLVEPPSPFCNCKLSGSVLVEAKTDERGNVTQAKARSGHPILRKASEKAALESKFLPVGIKAGISIVYHFETAGESDVRIKNIEIKEVKF